MEGIYICDVANAQLNMKDRNIYLSTYIPRKTENLLKNVFQIATRWI